MISSFLTRHGMAPEQVDVPLTCERFLGEMSAGLARMPSSMLMLPTYLTDSGPLPPDIPVAVIDAGGTNARVAKVTFTADGLSVEHLEVFPMPGSQGEITTQDFLDALAKRMLPFIRDCTTIGFCFSFPAEITPEKDGRVLYFDKEVKVAGSEGLLLMHGLTETLRRRGIPNLRGVVLNDTAAALLGGVSQAPSDAYEGFVGLVYGTGLNTCYSEPMANMAALSGTHDKRMLINTESGSFSRVIPGDFDLRLDAASKDPGRHLYEKMVSGAYLGEVIRHTLAGAAEEGLLPSGFSALEHLATYQADAFLLDTSGDNPLARLCENEEQRQRVRQVVEALTLRAARLVCANLAALLVRAGLGQNPDRPACIVAEGSTLYKSKLLFPYLEATMAEFVGNRLGLHYTFLRPDNATLRGAAAAALLNR